jgi:hypothetical protein
MHPQRKISMDLYSKITFSSRKQRLLGPSAMIFALFQQVLDQLIVPNSAELTTLLYPPFLHSPSVPSHYLDILPAEVSFEPRRAQLRLLPLPIAATHARNDHHSSHSPPPRQNPMSASTASPSALSSKRISTRDRYTSSNQTNSSSSHALVSSVDVWMMLLTLGQSVGLKPCKSPGQLEASSPALPTVLTSYVTRGGVGPSGRSSRFPAKATTSLGSYSVDGMRGS